jgi:hypothetical protein
MVNAVSRYQLINKISLSLQALVKKNMALELNFFLCTMIYENGSLKNNLVTEGINSTL